MSLPINYPFTSNMRKKASVAVHRAKTIAISELFASKPLLCGAGKLQFHKIPGLNIGLNHRCN